MNTLSEILDRYDRRSPIGSALNTEGWSRVPAALRERAFFSAGVENVRWLGELQSGIRSLIDLSKSPAPNGKGDMWASRDELIRNAMDLGEKHGMIAAPEDRGSIRDPLSFRRLKLIVDVQTQMAHGYGAYLSGQDPAVLEMWPAYELVRISARKEPRDWPARWKAAGGRDGVMAALKNDPIWRKISRFNQPWPPFDFESGKGLEEKDEEETIALGIDPKAQPPAEIEDINATGLVAKIPAMTPTERAWLSTVFGQQLHMTGDEFSWHPIAAQVPAPTLQQFPPILPIPPISPAPAPASPQKPVSAALQVNYQGKHKKAVTDAIKAIDSVHSDGVLPKIPIEGSAGKSLGVYSYKYSGQPSSIAVKSTGDWPKLTTAHEVGHFIDHQAFAPGQFESQKPNGAWSNVMSAIKTSQAYHDILSAPIHQASKNYFASDIELFARAYAQYIAVRSGNAEMINSITQCRTYVPWRQWSDTDFAPIAQAFDKALKKLGWMP
jgi:hypothetical protein